MTRLIAVDALEKRVEVAKLDPAANMFPGETLLIVSLDGPWRPERNCGWAKVQVSGLTCRHVGYAQQVVA
jgi:hypothetical protein